MYYFRDTYINNLLIEVDMTKNIQEVFDNVTKMILERKGKRKKVLIYNFKYGERFFNIEFNRTDNLKTFIKKIVIELHKITNRYYHQNIDREDDFKKLLTRFIAYENCGETIMFNFTSENNEWKNNLIKELSPYIVHDNQVNKHYEEIKPDFTNYLIKEPNKEVNIIFLNNYIDILLKYSKELQLNRYKNVSLSYFHGSDCTTVFRGIQMHLEKIKTELYGLINSVFKYTSDVIEIIPEGLRKIFDGVDIEKIDLLSFTTVLNDNAIAVKKYLEEAKGKGIAEYYASKKSGDYVGD